MGKRLALGRPHLAAAVPLVLAAAAVTAPVWADDESTLQEVVVTAQKREENLRDVPIAISAFGSDQIEQRHLETAYDLSSIVPNLQVSHTPNNVLYSQISMRGSNSINPAIYNDTTVGIYVDGVYMAKSAGSLIDLLDLQRIEVLRGPQGTLYGRNTLSGAVNYVTREPSGELSGSASVDGGNYSLWSARASLDLPKAGIASITLSGRVERRDGWMTLADGSPGASLGGLHDDQERVAVKLDFTDNFKALYAFDIADYNQPSAATQLYSTNPAFWNAIGLSIFNSFASTQRQSEVGIDYPSRETMRSSGHSLTFSWRLDENNVLKSISAYRELDSNDFFDLDVSPLNIASVNRHQRYQQWSQEFQLTGSAGSWNYVGGLYYFGDHGSSADPQSFFFGAVASDPTYVMKTRAYAAYGQLDYRLTTALTLSAGLRYSHETMDTNTTVYDDVHGGYLVPATPGHSSDGKVTPVAQVEYRLTPQVNAYAKYSEGFKSGGLNPEGGSVAEVSTPYKPETIDAFEVGTKTEFLNHRVQFNAAAFYNRISDLQLNIFLPGASTVSVLRNAGKATVYGLELEGNFAFTDWLLLRSSYGYLHSQYDEFIDGGIDEKDNRAFPHAPKNSFSAALDVRFAQGAWGTLRGMLDYTYTSDFYTYAYQLASSGPNYNPTQQVAANTMVRSVGLANARLSLGNVHLGSSATAELSLWVRNLADIKHANNFIDFGPAFGSLTTAYWDDPRTYGATINLRW